MPKIKKGARFVPKKYGVKAEKRARVKAANKMKDPVASVSGVEDGLKLESETCCVKGYRAQDLDHTLTAFVVDLFVTNMKAMYLSSGWGYDLEEKRKELFATTSRYLFAFPPPPPTSSHSTGLDCSNGNSAPLPYGYCHYRFVMDYGRPVLYCYEIQVEKKCQGKGIGKKFLEILVALGRKFEMEKIVATVFKSNTQSEMFFRKRGFALDETDDSTHPDVDYFILSLPLSVSVPGPE